MGTWKKEAKNRGKKTPKNGSYTLSTAQKQVKTGVPLRGTGYKPGIGGFEGLAWDNGQIRPLGQK